MRRNPETVRTPRPNVFGALNSMRVALLNNDVTAITAAMGKRDKTPAASRHW
jgi:hypothetical protein